jgi:hypothetical protein
VRAALVQGLDGGSDLTGVVIDGVRQSLEQELGIGPNVLPSRGLQRA